ncbi:hypothetical protein [Yoonia sp. I 8.24]|uniref:hypothetical protein n=1 Tax=Yoonia sp. I 8.24 TaxID=1537229 RepID=UPI001EE10FF0|nr:hypothetical protein [Yoonia sp. I 8.24]MCG3267964.1 hypothetical protein [Yoonia sp. I 8.24]
MTMKVEHEVHGRRKNRNYGVLILLLCFVGIVLGLTVVKVIQLGDARKFEATDHVARPQIIPEEGTE